MTINAIELRVAPASPVIGIGRSLLALAQASALIFSDVRSFFVPVGETTFELSCTTFLGKASLFCAMPDLQFAAALHVLMFLVVASGILPGITCFIHVYASYSFLGALALPDGGDMIAGSLALILVFVYAGDRRLTHWKTFGGRGKIATGISEGAQLAFKVQVAYIYLHSATAKFSVEAWADGTEMYLVTRQEMFGTSGLMGDIARLATEQPLITLALSWGGNNDRACDRQTPFYPSVERCKIGNSTDGGVTFCDHCTHRSWELWSHYDRRRNVCGRRQI